MLRQYVQLYLHFAPKQCSNNCTC